MKFSDNQSFYVTHDREEVGVKIRDDKFDCEVHFFVVKNQWEELKSKVDKAFEEMENP